eukprot:3100045-Rhodomonas_salina.1
MTRRRTSTVYSASGWGLPVAAARARECHGSAGDSEASESACQCPGQARVRLSLYHDDTGTLPTCFKLRRRP